MKNNSPSPNQNIAPIDIMVDEIFLLLKAKAQGDSISSSPARIAAMDSNIDFARQILRRRTERDQIFGSGLFGEPIWDMMLDLFVHMEVSVSSLCIAARIPSTTALRYISAMEQRGMIERKKDRNDNRRSLLSLSPPWHRKMDQLLTSWRSDRSASI